MNPNYGLMVGLNPDFQNKLFTKLLEKYDRKKLCKLLDRSSPTIYHYKNNKVKTLSFNVINKAIKLAKIKKEYLNKYTIRIYNAEEERRKIFKKGFELRRDKVRKQFKINVKIKDFVKKQNNFLFMDVGKWFDESKWLSRIKNQKGVINNVKRKINNKYIVLEYNCYTRNTNSMSKFVTTIPLKMKIDEEFLYFLGFRYGDGTSGARVGIANKNFELISYMSSYLRKLFPNSKIKGSLIYKEMNVNVLNELKSKICKVADEVDFYDLTKNKLKGDYVFSIFVMNRFFDRIYNDLVRGMDYLFKNLSFSQKGAFLAGFFDAEGNVNKLDKNFRWSQMIKKKVDIIKKLLIQEGYHLRYDGCNIVIAPKKEFRSNDLNLFEKQVLPFIKHPDKRKEAIELLNGYYVRDCYKNLVRLISNDPKIDNNGISNIINRKRSHRELSALTQAGFLKRGRNRVDESFKYCITEKGLKWIGGNKQ